MCSKQSPQGASFHISTLRYLRRKHRCSCAVEAPGVPLSEAHPGVLAALGRVGALPGCNQAQQAGWAALLLWHVKLGFYIELPSSTGICSYSEDLSKLQMLPSSSLFRW